MSANKLHSPAKIKARLNRKGKPGFMLWESTLTRRDSEGSRWKEGKATAGKWSWKNSNMWCVFFLSRQDKASKQATKIYGKRTRGSEGGAGRETDKPTNKLESPETDSSLFRNLLITMTFHFIRDRINPRVTLRQLKGHLNDELHSLPSTSCRSKFQIKQNLNGENESSKRK